jgi:NADH dehydrogenase
LTTNLANQRKAIHRPRVNFSLRKEVFFITVGSITGGFTMGLPGIVSDFVFGLRNYFYLAAASAVNSDSIAVGVALHFFVATIIGIVTGIILYKLNLLNISKILNGFIFGLSAGTVVFVVFAIPVWQLVLDPNLAEIISKFEPELTVEETFELVRENVVSARINSFMYHLIWGVTLGLIASFLTAKFGAHYRCYICDIEFSRINTYDEHVRYVHESPNPDIKKILILGGGYAGVGVLRRIQKQFERDVNVSISLVSEDNFFLHTPMLPELATGTIEARHIATPIRNFCKRARFYQARVVSIDLKGKTVLIERMSDKTARKLEYDYLVLAMGAKTNFFGNKNLEKYALTVKSLDDAIKIRNHVIAMLEDADQETNQELQSKLVTSVVVGGGFSGVETAGELNDFVRESVEKFYRNIDPENIRVILVSSGETILPEIGELGKYAMKALTKAGVTVLTKTRLQDAEKGYVILSNGTTIPYGTLIWAAGNTIEQAISELDTGHHKDGRVVVDEFLRLQDRSEVFALGDCAFIVDKRSQSPYPQTAQHAIREAQVVVENLVSVLQGQNKLTPFVYDTKGTMAKIGRRDGVALLIGHVFTGFAAWFIWKQYYLSTLPLTEKKIRIGLDWFIDLFFPRDITRLTHFR